MLAFIDESGCSGFKLSRGSDSVFAIGMVIFADSDSAVQTELCMQRVRERSRHKSEFKFSKCSDRLRDDFFSSIAECPFRVRALVVEKRLVYSAHLRRTNGAFYNFFIKQLVQHDVSVLRDARVRIDGSGDREFQRALKTYLRRDIEGKIADLRLVDSKRDSLMQLADMCIGAVARSYRDRANGSRWLRMLRPRIEDIWQFR